ncbi:MAG: IclR family transcriptional regulator [Nocardioides sp.]|nr:IclR family transcriptional regulator [Nocardioides sp.]
MVAESAKGTQAVERAAALVATAVRADEPLGFAELVESCDLAKSTASRLLTALERAELLERDANGLYRAGPLFWLYAARHDRWDELVRLARPTLQQLGDDTRETVNLAVAQGDRVIQVGQVDSQYMLGTRDWTQIDVPPHASALGKVLYAYAALPVPRGGLQRLTPRTVADGVALEHQLGQTRRQGFAVTVDELEIGLSGVAVPVRGGRGEVVAALGVSGPTQRFQGRVDEVGRLLTDRARGLSALLDRGSHQERRSGSEGAA